MLAYDYIILYCFCYFALVYDLENSWKRLRPSNLNDEEMKEKYPDEKSKTWFDYSHEYIEHFLD